jgi:hypothetical protein
VEEEPAKQFNWTSPCETFDCNDDCCQYGVDVEVEERDLLIANGLAKPGDFTGPEEEDGFLMYRTELGPRGCIFLLPERGCRLHHTGYKPLVCKIFPRDEAELREAFEDGSMPCYGHCPVKEPECGPKPLEETT